jgi:hypothetical protein
VGGTWPEVEAAAAAAARCAGAAAAHPVEFLAGIRAVACPACRGPFNSAVVGLLGVVLVTLGSICKPWGVSGAVMLGITAVAAETAQLAASH